MKRYMFVVLVFLLASLPVFAGQVPGTSVSLIPPEGFVSAERFSGFIDNSTGSSIMVSEIPGPYGEMAAGFSDQKRMQAQGMKLISNTSTKVDDNTAMLLRVEQSAYGTLFKKWIVIVDHAGATTLIVATYPESVEELQGEDLKAAVLAASFGEPTDPVDALTFTVELQAPFQVAKVYGQNMILSPEGRFPLDDENKSLMVLGLSASENLVVPNQLEFAENRISKTATVKNISVNQSTPINIGKLSGYATTAEGKGESSGTPLSIYQVLLFDTSGYCLIQGITPSAQKSTYMPVFEKIARSFKMKEK